jgi:hypothetical protein
MQVLITASTKNKVSFDSHTNNHLFFLQGGLKNGKKESKEEKSYKEESY